MDRPVVALVLAGGVGTRLYPAARPDRPKQFLSLGGDRSLLARTVARTDFADEVAVVTRERYADEVRERAPDADVLVEPAPADSGPALVYATHRLARAREVDPVVVALPSDHRVGDDDAFRETMTTGARVAAETGALVTFGVEPTRPETGYGYLEPGADRGAYRELDSFHEKPDPETARAYVAAGYRWNAGIFAWGAESFLRAARDSPLAPLVDALDRGDPAAGYEAVDPVSVDRAVMERASDAALVPASFPWDDLGTWDALGRVGELDDCNNAVEAPATLLDSRDNVVATDGTHVSLVGVEDLAVVAYDDRVLVVPREEAGRVRDLVGRLRANEHGFERAAESARTDESAPSDSSG